MAQFRIQIDKAVCVAENITAFGGNLHSYSRQLADVLAALKRDDAISSMPVCSRLKAVNAVVLEEAAKMESLEKALRHIVTAYSDSERQNLNFFGSKESHGINATGHDVSDRDVKKFFHRFFIGSRKSFNGTRSQKKGRLK